MAAADTPLYSVVITTYRRPRAVLRAVQSVLLQDRSPRFELIVVDNDPNGSALKSLRKVAEEATIPVVILHERRIGIAVARNRGLAAATGSFVAFLDDDQAASPRWLHHLARMQESTGADVVFGSVHSRVEPIVSRHRGFFEEFFSRDPDHDEGIIEEIYGCSCVLIRRSALGDTPAFREDFADCHSAIEPLFDRMRAEKKIVGWAASAWAWRIPRSSELSMIHALRSAYNHGRGKTGRRLRAGSRRLIATTASCLSGFFQILAYGPVSMALFMLRSKRRAFAYRLFAEGAGKLLWPSVFRLRGPDIELMPIAA